MRGLSGLVFVQPSGEDLRGEAARTKIGKVVKIAMREAEVLNATFQMLRHTCVSWMVQNGCSLFEIKEQLGHATYEMTLRYAHLAPENRKEALRSIDAALA